MLEDEGKAINLNTSIEAYKCTCTCYQPTCNCEFLHTFSVTQAKRSAEIYTYSVRG